jgi:hypothetical protein
MSKKNKGIMNVVIILRIKGILAVSIVIRHFLSAITDHLNIKNISTNPAFQITFRIYLSDGGLYSIAMKKFWFFCSCAKDS